MAACSNRKAVSKAQELRIVATNRQLNPENEMPTTNRIPQLVIVHAARACSAFLSDTLAGYVTAGCNKRRNSKSVIATNAGIP
jgi:hypothetical protein